MEPRTSPHMSSSHGPWDASLIDLFRSEVETHSELLSICLLALERNPGDTSRVDEMMRAAHSIKGASRVVGVDPAVQVAHVMEDCFVAAQKGAIQLTPGDVDVLLRGVDLISNISTATRDPEANLNQAFDGDVQKVVLGLRQVLAGNGTATEPRSAVVLPVATTSQSIAPNDVALSFPAMLDGAAAEELRRQFLSAIKSECKSIRFDLTATKDLDVQGLALLAAAPRYLAVHGQASLQLAGVSKEMALVLRVTGLDTQYGISDTLLRGAQ